jgi:3-oxoacyl-[acyl-carrier-protein] synthase II
VARRIVITGCGVVTGAGTDLNEFWRNLESGTCAVRPLVDFAIPGIEQPYGAVAELPASERFPANADTDPYRGRCGHLALAAARRALDDAGIPSRSPLLETAATLIGTTLGEERQAGDLNERLLADESTAIDPGFFWRSDNHRITTLVAEEHGFGGPAWVPATACSSSNAAIALGSDLIRTGACDVVLVGGTDTLTRLTYCGFQRVGALAKAISRPFDKNRDGVAFGEGALILVIDIFDLDIDRYLCFGV